MRIIYTLMFLLDVRRDLVEPRRALHISILFQ